MKPIQTPKHETRPLDKTRISWHAAFVEAIRLELEQYRDILEFRSEFPLASEPLKIDLVIIRKTKDVVIEKNIAALFRKHNILEFKSPTDYLSLNDFYKVYGYVCIYASLENIPITDLTVTLIASRRPGKLLRHLREIRLYAVEERSPGIYTVTGDIIPIQIIDSRKLSEEENLWLRNLDNRLNAERIKRITDEIARLGKTARIQAYLDVIVRANAETLEEVMFMGKVTLEQVLERTGLIAKWKAQGKVEGEVEGEARGKAEGKHEVAQNLIKIGMPLEQVAQVTGLDTESLAEYSFS